MSLRKKFMEWYTRANLQPPPRVSSGFTIADDGQSITCHRCGKRSCNLNDVNERYCGYCHIFHEDRDRQ